MKEPALVIIKPDAISKGLVGNILLKFAEKNLEIIGMRVFNPTRKLVEEHYRDVKGKPFFKGTVDFFLGKFHKQNKVIAIVYYGEDSIAKCRKTAGATSPEDAAPQSIRGAYGRITTKGIYENVVHVSATKRDAKREIKLWFKPDSLSRKIYPIKTVSAQQSKSRIWS